MNDRRLQLSSRILEVLAAVALLVVIAWALCLIWFLLEPLELTTPMVG